MMRRPSRRPFAFLSAALLLGPGAARATSVCRVDQDVRPFYDRLHMADADATYQESDDPVLDELQECAQRLLCLRGAQAEPGAAPDLPRLTPEQQLGLTAILFAYREGNTRPPEDEPTGATADQAPAVQPASGGKGSGAATASAPASDGAPVPRCVLEPVVEYTPRHLARAHMRVALNTFLNARAPAVPVAVAAPVATATPVSAVVSTPAPSVVAVSPAGKGGGAEATFGPPQALWRDLMIATPQAYLLIHTDDAWQRPERIFDGGFAGVDHAFEAVRSFAFPTDLQAAAVESSRGLADMLTFHAQITETAAPQSLGGSTPERRLDHFDLTFQPTDSVQLTAAGTPRAITTSAGLTVDGVNARLIRTPTSLNWSVQGSNFSASVTDGQGDYRLMFGPFTFTDAPNQSARLAYAHNGRALSFTAEGGRDGYSTTFSLPQMNLNGSYSNYAAVERAMLEWQRREGFLRRVRANYQGQATGETYSAELDGGAFDGNWTLTGSQMITFGAAARPAGGKGGSVKGGAVAQVRAPDVVRDSAEFRYEIGDARHDALTFDARADSVSGQDASLTYRGNFRAFGASASIGEGPNGARLSMALQTVPNAGSRLMVNADWSEQSGAQFGLTDQFVRAGGATGSLELRTADAGSSFMVRSACEGPWGYCLGEIARGFGHGVAGLFGDPDR